jgi:predicted TIM-barrel fold metal-dependent hydrolase
MQTPWGEFEVRDAHVHFFSHSYFTLLAGQKAGLRVEEMGQLLGWEMPPQEPEKLAARWVEELDRHGVAQSVLIASLPGDEDSVIAAVKAFPKRFFGYFFLNPLAPDAVSRAERALEGGLRGICLFPAMHGFFMHDERVRPVLELAAAHGAVVFVHCGVLTVGVRKKLGLASPFELRFSNPVDLHGVALRYPQLRFVIPHFGAGYFREALMVADLCPNVFLDTSSSNSWMRYQAPPVDLKMVFERALEVAGARRLLFGTDSSFFPRGWHRAIFDEQVKALEAIGVTAEDARAIFGENLAGLLGGTLR